MADTIKIANKIIGDNQSCFIIAEIGINHNGSVELAKKLIKEAYDSGCDAVKFQKRTVDVVYTEEEGWNLDMRTLKKLLNIVKVLILFGLPLVGMNNQLIL